HDYSPSSCDAEDESSSAEEDVSEEEKSHDSSTVINAFQLIGMSPFLDLSGLFETELKAIREESTRKGQGGLSLTAELCERLLKELDASSQR
ncbi:hypothetical protein F2Q68_00038749, partial [Brassica cretica]